MGRGIAWEEAAAPVLPDIDPIYAPKLAALMARIPSEGRAVIEVGLDLDTIPFIRQTSSGEQAIYASLSPRGAGTAGRRADYVQLTADTRTAATDAFSLPYTFSASARHCS